MQRQKKIRVVIADDHPIVLEGTRLLLQRTTDIEVVGAAADGGTALRLASELAPDVLMLDLRLPDLSGVAVAQRVRSALPQVGIVVITGYDDLPAFRALVRLGVQGYLRKTAPGEEILDAVRTVAGGKRFLQLEALRTLRPPRVEPLTERERYVLHLLVAGLRNAEVAGELALSVRTVEFHVRNLLHKLGARSRAEAVAAAIEHDPFLPLAVNFGAASGDG